MANTKVKRTRLQLNFNEMPMTLVTVRQELEESRAATTTARVAEEAGRQQLAHMMDKQLVQSQAIEALRRQLETSNNATRDAQALLRMNQEQQQQHVRMPLPTTLPTLTGGIVSNTPFVQPFSTDYAQESYTVQDIIMLVHRQIQVMQKVCGPCSGETKWTHHDVTPLPLGHPRRGLVLSLLRGQHGRSD